MLVRKLPPEERAALLRELLLTQSGTWAALSSEGQAGIRAQAEAHGTQWEMMGEAEREALIDDMVHEARGCP